MKLSTKTLAIKKVSLEGGNKGILLGKKVTDNQYLREGRSTLLVDGILACASRQQEGLEGRLWHRR